MARDLDEGDTECSLILLICRYDQNVMQVLRPNSQSTADFTRLGSPFHGWSFVNQRNEVQLLTGWSKTLHTLNDSGLKVMCYFKERKKEHTANTSIERKKRTAREGKRGTIKKKYSKIESTIESKIRVHEVKGIKQNKEQIWHKHTVFVFNVLKQSLPTLFTSGPF